MSENSWYDPTYELWEFFFVLFFIIIFQKRLFYYVFRFQTEHWRVQHSLQEGMKCVWTVWSCCCAITGGQHYVIVSAN